MRIISFLQTINPESRESIVIGKAYGAGAIFGGLETKIYII